jgi:hypothetical protein
MIEGRRKLLQISAMVYRRPDGSIVKQIIEREHRNVRFKRYLPAGPLPGGGVRQQDLIQFYSDPGGLRTVQAEDIVL